LRSFALGLSKITEFLLLKLLDAILDVLDPLRLLVRCWDTENALVLELRLLNLERVLDLCAVEWDIRERGRLCLLCPTKDGKRRTRAICKYNQAAIIQADPKLVLKPPTLHQSQIEGSEQVNESERERERERERD